MQLPRKFPKSGIINYNVDTLISSYFNCSKCLLRRAVDNQIYPEGSFESRVDEALNNVFLLLTSLCEFYDYENSKAIYDTFCFTCVLIDLIQQNLIIL